jgi:hypothetical protein
MSKLSLNDLELVHLQTHGGSCAQASPCAVSSSMQKVVGWGKGEIPREIQGNTQFDESESLQKHQIKKAIQEFGRAVA